jgi:hypothetical protein
VTSASAVNPIRVAMAEVLKTIPALTSDDPAIGGHVYHEGEVRRGDPVPRIVIGAAFETPRGASRYGQRGHMGNEFLKCWGNDSWEAQEVFSAAKSLLDNTVLPLDPTEGHAMVRGEVERVTDYPEPDPEITAHVVIGRYLHEVRSV